MTYRIYYGDGTTFSSADGNPEDAPAYNVQLIAQDDDGTVGCTIESGKDFYLIIEGHWIGVDRDGLIDYLANVLRIVKVGRMIPDTQFRSIRKQALADRDLKRKSARLQRERK